MSKENFSFESQYREVNKPAIAPLRIDQTEGSKKFLELITHECIIGSAISPSLYDDCIEIHSDLEIVDGEPTTPIHDALNWRYTRFGKSANANLKAAFFLQENSEVWQAKLSQPLIDAKGKTRKYETPKDGGSKAYLPPINREIRIAISKRYHCEVPPCGESFWTWIETHPEIDIILTEGGKKALCLLSHGYVAIAFVGVNGGYMVNQYGVRLPAPKLTPDLERFAITGRRFILAFDKDPEIKQKTVYRVRAAIRKLSGLLVARGCDVANTKWEPSQGKGVDDLIVQTGLATWEKAYNSAKSLREWFLQEKATVRFKQFKPNLIVNVPDLSTAISPASIPKTGIIIVNGDTGVGKTKFLVNLLNESDRPFAKIGHRRSLERNAAQRLDAVYLGDTERIEGRLFDAENQCFISDLQAKRVTVVADSLLKVKLEDVTDGDLIIDEADQLFRHLLTSSTCRTDGKRPLLLKHFAKLAKVARRIILLSATLRDREIAYICKLCDTSTPDLFLVNEYKRKRGKLDWIQCGTDSAIVSELLEAIKAGRRPLVVIDSLKKAEAIASLVATIIGEDKIFQYNSKTSGTTEGLALSRNPDAFYDAYPQYLCSIFTPSGFTGLSIEDNLRTLGELLECERFTDVFGLFYGRSVVTDDCLQSLERLRAMVKRTVWAARYGSSYSHVSKSTNPLELKSALKTRTDRTVQLTRNELTPEKADSINRYGWSDNPHLNAWLGYEGDRNFAMANFGDFLRVSLEVSGYQVNMRSLPHVSEIAKLVKKIATENKRKEAEAISGAISLTEDQVMVIDRKDGKTPDELRAIEKYRLAEWLHILVDNLSTEDVLFDQQSTMRSQINRLEHLLCPSLAMTRDTKNIDRYTDTDQNNSTPWDYSTHETQRWLTDKLGIINFLIHALDGDEWGAADNALAATFVQTCRNYSNNIKEVFGFTVTDKMRDSQVIGEMLSRIGLKVSRRTERKQVAKKRKVYHFYSLDFSHLSVIREILKRRLAKLLVDTQNSGSPLLVKILFEGVIHYENKEISPILYLPESEVPILLIAEPNNEAVTDTTLFMEPIGVLAPQVDIRNAAIAPISFNEIPDKNIEWDDAAIAYPNLTTEMTAGQLVVETVTNAIAPSPIAIRNTSIPIQWKVGMMVMYQGFDWLIATIGTATAKIVRGRVEFWVDIPDLEVCLD